MAINITGDPYVVFNTGRVAEIRVAVSHYTMTKLFIAAFLWGAYLLWRGKIFAE